MSLQLLNLQSKSKTHNQQKIPIHIAYDTYSKVTSKSQEKSAACTLKAYKMSCTTSAWKHRKTRKTEWNNSEANQLTERP